MPVNAFDDRLPERVDVLVRAILGVQVEPRRAGAPARVVADVAADVREQRRAVQAVADCAASPGNASPLPALRAELEEQVRRREPLDLHAVLRALAAEERLVDERLIDEVPGMRVHFVEVAEAREEAPALGREALGQRRRAEERLFDFDLVLAGDRGGQLAGKIRIDVRRERELGLAEIEAALAGTDLAAVRHEAGDVPVSGIARGVGVAAGEHDARSRD